MRAFLSMLCLFVSTCALAGGGDAGPAPDTNPPAPTAAIMRFEGPVTEESAAAVAAGFEAVETLPEESRPEAMIIEINSPGGEVDAGFKIVKTLERSPLTVICVVDGEAASMAFYILQSCDLRLATPRSSLMLHGVAIGGFIRLTESNAASLAKQIAVYNSAMIGQVAARMTVPRDFIEAKMKEGDWWMDANEAMSVGAIDAIIPVALLP